MFSSPPFRPANRLPAILILDDELRSQEALRRTLEEDFEVFCADSAEAGMKILDNEQSTANFRIVLCDQRMPETTGVQFLKEVRTRWPDLVRIILSGYTDAEDIITGINEAGIWQYLLKPWQPEQLLLTLQRASEVWRLQQDNQRLTLDLRTAEPTLRQRVERKQQTAKQRFGIDSLIRAPDSPLTPLCELIERIAPYDLSIMISGESGAGKEMVARAIHYTSRRSDKPFITENCGALPDNLLESELFGHKRGAFTGAVEDRIGLFQQADGGTLFLDEIGETSPAFQVKLLRVLQEGEFRPLGSNRPVRVDVRVITATNRDLQEDVRTGRFREDLYYRLSTMPMHIPPLRERPMDLPRLADHLLQQASRTLNKPIQGIDPEVMNVWAAYAWPGNVRELQNEILRMLALAPGVTLRSAELAPRLLNRLQPALPSNQAHLSLDTLLAPGLLKDAVDTLEAALLTAAQQRHRGNKSRMARELGLSRVGLRHKLARYQLLTQDDEDET